MTSTIVGNGLLNRVFNCDVADLLKEIPSDFVDCIFADPDYNVGVRYNNRTYKRKFDDYIAWLGRLCTEFHRVLRPDGNLFIINYPKNNAHLRVRFLDDLFFAIYEYIWVYNTNVGHHSQHFTTAHRSILHCTKSPNNKFFKEQVAQPYQNPTDRRIRRNIANGSPGRMPYSWVYFNLVKNVSREKTFHSCQIPEKLSELLIKASTSPGDAVFIPFGGSGAEISVCIRNGRQFIAAEIDTVYYEMILDRIAQEGGIDRRYRLLERIRERQRNGSKGVNRVAQLHLIKDGNTIPYELQRMD